MVLSLLNNRQIRYADDTSNTIWDLPINLLPESWHHYAITRDDSNDRVELFVDGVSLGSRSVSLTTLDVEVGPGGSANAFNVLILGLGLVGQMNDVAVWDRILTPAEIQSRVYRFTTGLESGLVAKYSFEEGSGNKVFDSSLNNFDSLIRFFTTSFPSWSTNFTSNFRENPLFVDRDFTSTELASLETLNTERLKVSDLTGLERLVNLTTLNLSASEPDSAADIASLIPPITSSTSPNVGDTFIAEANPTTSAGNSPVLRVNGSAPNCAAAFFRFDLSSQAGQRVSGDPSFFVSLQASQNPQAVNTSITLELRESTGNWNDNSTWNNIPGGPPTGSISGTVLETVTLTYNAATDGDGTINFNIPEAIVQRWIDDPDSNRGVVIRSLTTAANNELRFTSNNGDRNFAPTLSVLIADVPGYANLDNDDIANLTPRRLTSGPQAGELVGLPRLQNLDLSNQKNVSDISPLAEIKGLKTLRLDRTGVVPIGPSTLATLDSFDDLRTLNLPTRLLPLNTNLVFNEGQNISLPFSVPALDFNGSNQSVDLGTAQVLGDLRNQFTVAAWVKPDATTGIQRVISSKVANFGWGLGLSGTGLRFTTYGNTDYDIPASLVAGEWTHIAAAMKANNSVEFFVNGVSIGSRTGSFLSTPSSNGFQIGLGIVGGEGFNGKLGEIGVWNRVLSASEIGTVRQSFPDRANSGLIGYWPLNETSGDSAFDLSPGKLTGVLRNGPLHTSETSIPWTVTGAVTASGSASPIAFRPTNNGIPIVTVRNFQFPLVVRNVAPTVTQTPNLGGANSGAGLNEGQTLTVSNATVTGNTLRYDVLADGTVVDSLLVTEPSSVDRADLATRISITDGNNNTTDLTQASLALGGTNGAYVATALKVDQTASTSGATFELWLRPTTSTGNRFAFDTLGSGNQGWALLHNGTNWIIDNGTSQFTTSLTVSLNQWQRLSVVFNPAGGVTVYKRLDGSPNVTTSNDATIGFTNNGGTLVIGADAAGNATSRFVGNIDEFRVWNRPLSAAELNALDDGPIDANTPNLIGYWSFNEAAGLVARDRSIGGNNGVLTAANYRSGVIADSPIAYYGLNIATTPTIDEIAGRNGTVTGTTAIASPLAGGSRVGQSLRFNGTSDRIDVAFDASLNPASNFSLELWARVDGGADTTRGALTSLRSVAAGADLRGYFLQAATNNRWTFGTANGTSQFDLVTGPEVQLGSWTHLVATFKATSNVLDANGALPGISSLYVNGELVGTLATSYKPNNFRMTRIGASGTETNTPSGFFNGGLDEVAIYGKALTLADVEQHYQTGTGQRAALAVDAVASNWSNNVATIFPVRAKLLDNGIYTLNIATADRDGGTAVSQTTFNVNNLAPVIALSNFNAVGATSPLTVPPPGVFIQVGQSVNLTAVGTTDPGVLDTFTYRWDVASNNGQAVNSSDALQFSFVPQSSGVYEVVLTVTDNDGASSVVRQTVVVRPDANISNTPAGTIPVGTLATLSALTSSEAAVQSNFRGDVQTYRREHIWTSSANAFVGPVPPNAATVNIVSLAAGVQPVNLTVNDLFETPTATVSLQQATALFSQATTTPNNLIDNNPATFWGNSGNTAIPDNNTAVFETVSSLNTEGDLVLLTIRIVSGDLAGENLGKFRLSATTDARTTFADGLSSVGDVTANWIELTPVTASATAATLTMNADRSITASGATASRDTYVVQVLTSLTNITGFRLEALADASLPTTGPGRAANGNFQVYSLAIEQGGSLRLSDSTSINITATAPTPALDIAANVLATPAISNGGFETTTLAANTFKFYSTMTPTEQAASIWTTAAPSSTAITANISSLQSGGIAAPKVSSTAS